MPYKELNDVQLDLSRYEEESLSELEQKKWEKRVLNKLHKRKRGQSSKWSAGTAAAFVLTVGLMIPFGGVTLAKIPFVGAIVEKFISQTETLDYSTYKTAIGQTAENKYGKLTLNEVLVDADRLLISSTFEPARGVSFDYQTSLPPSVLINGEDFQLTRTSQSIEVTDDMFTIYGEAKFSELSTEGPLQVKISYDTISKRDRVAIEEPWVFDITVSTAQIMKDTTTIQLDKTITLNNGERVTLEKVVVSPISTMLYYDLSQASETTRFKLVSANDEEISFREGAHSEEETSYSRYNPIDLEKATYSLVPINSEHEAIGPAVPLK